MPDIDLGECECCPEGGGGLPCCGNVWVLPAVLCLTVAPDPPCAAFPPAGLTLSPGTFNNQYLCLTAGWTGGVYPGTFAAATRPCAPGLCSSACAFICPMSLGVSVNCQGVLLPVTDGYGDPCLFIYFEDVLSFSPFLAVVRAKLPFTCCGGQDVLLTLTEGPCP